MADNLGDAIVSEAYITKVDESKISEQEMSDLVDKILELMAGSGFTMTAMYDLKERKEDGE